MRFESGPDDPTIGSTDSDVVSRAVKINAMYKQPRQMLLEVSDPVVQSHVGRRLTANTCTARTANDWAADGCVFQNPTAVKVILLGSHNRVDPTVSCEVSCPVDGGDFVVSSASGLTAITDENIHAAVDAWATNPDDGTATYGHITWWDTQGVTDMNMLFCGSTYRCGGSSSVASAKNTFNENLAHW